MDVSIKDLIIRTEAPKAGLVPSGAKAALASLGAFNQLLAQFGSTPVAPVPNGAPRIDAGRGPDTRADAASRPQQPDRRGADDVRSTDRDRSSGQVEDDDAPESAAAARIDVSYDRPQENSAPGAANGGNASAITADPAKPTGPAAQAAVTGSQNPTPQANVTKTADIPAALAGTIHAATASPQGSPQPTQILGLPDGEDGLTENMSSKAQTVSIIATTPGAARSLATGTQAVNPSATSQNSELPVGQVTVSQGPDAAAQGPRLAPVPGLLIAQELQAADFTPGSQAKGVANSPAATGTLPAQAQAQGTAPAASANAIAALMASPGMAADHAAPLNTAGAPASAAAGVQGPSGVSGPGAPLLPGAGPLTGAGTASTQATAARNPATAAVPFDQVAVRIARAAAQGMDSISIKLKPAALGHIEVKLELHHDGRVAAVVTADRTDTLDMLQRDAKSLERALQDAGLKTDSGSLQFTLRHDGAYAGEHDGNDGPFGNDGSLGDDPMTAAADDPELPLHEITGYANARAASGGIDISV